MMIRMTMSECPPPPSRRSDVRFACLQVGTGASLNPAAEPSSPLAAGSNDALALWRSPPRRWLRG